MRALIVDDEPLPRDNLRLALAPHAAIEVVGEAANGTEALALATEVEPDLVFLDIQMPDMDGFAVARELQAHGAPIIVFVTAYDEHALRAFEVHAMDYLLKPIDDARLLDCVTRVRSYWQGPVQSDASTRLGTDGRDAVAEAERTPTERILVRRGHRLYFVPVVDVDTFESAGNYVRLHTGNTQHLIRASLSDLETRLDGRQFVRVHRTSIVNLHRIREVEPFLGGDYVATLLNGRKVRVSRTYRDNLLRPFA